MNTNVSLEVQIRDVIGKKVQYLRKQGLLPATVYGKGFGPVSIQVQDRTFETVYHQVGKTTLLSLTIPGQKIQAAFIQSIQRHPVTRKIVHADFRVVDLQVEMNAEIPIFQIGETSLIERGEASLNHVLSFIEVRGLPSDLPRHIEVDISSLDSFDKTIHVSDLSKPAGCTFVTPGNMLVMSLSHVRVEAEEETSDKKGSEPVLIRKERENE
jgi:large subunit ribosomal protein L25